MKPKFIDLRSDTVTKPSKAMRQAIAEAEVGDDVFEDDPTVKKLEEMTAELLGKGKALFVPSGTMANEVAIKSLTKPGDEVVLEGDSHIYNYEVGAPSVLCGVQLHTLKGKRGILTAQQILDHLRPQDIHVPQTTLICLENTHNRAGGTIYPIEEIKKIREATKPLGIKMHLDGARLWNATIATGIPLDEYARHFDSVSVSLSKGLGAPIGSVICGSSDFILIARRNRKMFGGGMRQVGIIAAAGIYAIENNFNRLNEDHRNAKALAEGLSKIPKISVDSESVQTNIVVIDIKESGMEVGEVLEELKEKGVLAVPFGRNKIRCVTHLDVTRDDIDQALETFQQIFAPQRIN
ncbi:MAG: low-specificity L-threonine aldolase [candidate division Zixibacteria bacterium]|nr:low-specificity L-threonine aldolase [candidate division Zixibacteria bacterium]